MSSGQEVGAIFGDGTGPAAALLRSPTVIIASIALWGMNVCFFRLFGIDYVYVLLLDLKKEEDEEQKKQRLKTKQSRNNNINNATTSDSSNHGVHIHTELQDIADDYDGLKLTEEQTEKRKIEMSGLSMLASDSEELDEKHLVNVPLFPDSPSSKEAKAVVNHQHQSPDNQINEVRLIGLAGTLIFTLYLTSYLWIQVGRGTTIGAIFCFYMLVTVGIITPLPSTSWIRLACKTVFLRALALVKPRCSCVHGKPRPVPFIDVFFADGMCSMSKVFFDWGMLWLLASNYPNPVPPSLQSIIVPSCFASLPYLIRARQCLIMYNVGFHKNDPKRYQHVLNAIKYSTSLFPLIVSAFQKTTYGQQIGQNSETLLIVLLIVNATYCLAWDIVMDWGMMQNPNAVVEQAVGQCMPSLSSFTTHPPSPISDGSSSELKQRQARNCLDTALRPRLRFGTSMTLLIVFLDTCLRFSWTLRFYESRIFGTNDAYILCTEFLEVFRRAVWNLLRVEWEHIKQTRKTKKEIQYHQPIAAIEMVETTRDEPILGRTVSRERKIIS